MVWGAIVDLPKIWIDALAYGRGYHSLEDDMYFSEQFESRSESPFDHGQHHSCSLFNEHSFVPFSHCTRDDRSHSYLNSLEDIVSSSILPTQSLQCMGRCPVEVKYNASEMTFGTVGFM